jgi:hypothetical protein
MNSIQSSSPKYFSRAGKSSRDKPLILRNSRKSFHKKSASSKEQLPVIIEDPNKQQIKDSIIQEFTRLKEVPAI